MTHAQILLNNLGVDQSAESVLVTFLSLSLNDETVPLHLQAPTQPPTQPPLVGMSRLLESSSEPMDVEPSPAPAPAAGIEPPAGSRSRRAAAGRGRAGEERAATAATPRKRRRR